MEIKEQNQKEIIELPAPVAQFWFIHGQLPPVEIRKKKEDMSSGSL